MFNFLKKLKCEILYLSIITELCMAVLFNKNEDYKGSKYAQFVMKELEREFKDA
jgi:hypothetical protein